MKNRKGFTLVELMAVIVILAVIIAIAVPTFGNVQKSIEKKNYENQISLIETAAAKYFEDNNITSMYVDDLIKSGYLEADDKNGKIFATNDKTKELNCYIVRIENENGQYYPKFINKNFKNGTNICPYNKLNEINNLVKVNLKDTAGKQITDTTNYWSKENIIMSLEIIDDTYKNNIQEISWYEGNQIEPIVGMHKKFDKPISFDKIDENLKSYTKEIASETSYYENIKVRLVINLDGDLIPIQSNVEIKIDKTKPIISENDKWSPDIEQWSNKKTYNFTAIDQDSNYYGYLLLDNSNEDCSIDLNKYTKSSTINFNDTVTTAKTNKLCIIDYAGNVNYKNIIVKNIDNTTLPCNIKVEGTKGNYVNNTQWYKSNVVLTLEVKAGPTGASIGLTDDATKKDKTIVAVNANETKSAKMSIMKNTENKKYYGIVRTGAGNVSTCDISLAVEKTMPTISVSRNVSGYTEIGTYFSYQPPLSGIASESCSYALTGSSSYANALTSDKYCYVNFGTYATPVYNYWTDNYYSIRKTIVSNAGNSASGYGSPSHFGRCHQTSVEEDDYACESGNTCYAITTYKTVSLYDGDECGTNTTTSSSYDADCCEPNKKPTITIKPNGNSTYKKEHSVKFRVKDDSGEIKTIKYRLATSDNCSYDSSNDAWKSATSAAFEKYKSVNIKYKKFDSDNGRLATNKYYLWVYAKDKDGKYKCKSTTNPFYIDNTAPTISCNCSNKGNSNSICARNSLELKWYTQCDYTDGHSGVATSTGSVTWGGNTDRYLNSGNLLSATAASDPTKDTLCCRSSSWTYSVEIYDNAGNKATKSGSCSK